MWGIRRCAHGEEFFRFREAKRLDNSVHACANNPLAGMGKMSIVRAATEVPGRGRPSLSALWDAMGLAIGKLCRSVSAGIGQIGVLSSSPMRGALRAEKCGRDACIETQENRCADSKGLEGGGIYIERIENRRRGHGGMGLFPEEVGV